MIHNHRTGTVGATHLQGVAYDPSDVARTTIKETNIHNTRTGNINSGLDHRGIVYDPNDVARTTLKETNIHNTRTGNMRLIEKGTVVDKETASARTTLRNTLESEDTVLNMTGRAKSIVYDPNDLARTTLRETTSVNDHNGHLVGESVKPVASPFDQAKTTIKETTENNHHTGYVGGQEKHDGYLTTSVTAPSTNRQTLMTEYTGTMDGSGGASQGYLTTGVTAPPTNREFLSKDYTGGADSNSSKPRNYQDAYNMTLNEVRQDTLKRRDPVQEFNKVSTGAAQLNVRTNKRECERENNRQYMSDKTYNLHKNITNCEITQRKQAVDQNTLDQRLHPSILQAFRENPFSKSLHSYF